MRAGQLAVLCVAASILAACVRLGFEGRSTAPGSDAATAGDIQLDAGGEGPPTWTEFTFNSFAGLWRLPHTLAWLWKCPISPADFSHHRLCVATDPAALAKITGDCLGPDDDTTLAMAGCGSGYHQGMTYELQPETTYHARVWAFNKAGEAIGSGVASQTTAAAPPGQVEIFDETLPALVGCKIASSKPYSGKQALEATVTNNDWTSIGIRGLGLTLPGMNAARFGEAYFEMYVELSHPREVRVILDGAIQQMLYSPPLGYVTVDGRPGYQRIQFPLKRLTELHTGDPNPALIGLADVAEIKSATLNSYFLPGTVRVDAISIRY